MIISINRALLEGGDSMFIPKRILILSALCVLNCGTVFCDEREDLGQEKLQNQSKQKEKMSVEEAYEALDKDQYDKLRTIVTDKEMIDELLNMSADKGSSTNVKKIQFCKRINDDKDKEKQQELDSVQKKLELCREKTQTRAFIVGVGSSVFSIAAVYGLAKIISKIAGT